MTDDIPKNANDLDSVDDGRMAGHMPVMIHAQYIKDLSFENPNAPGALQPRGEGRPTMDVNFSMDARQLEESGRDNLYEVVLGVNVAARRGDETLFLIEILYGIKCSLRAVPAEKRHAMLLIEMPRHAFPFVRQIVANLTQQAGYMPLLLSPVDFKRFYIENFANNPEKQVIRGSASAEEEEKTNEKTA